MTEVEIKSIVGDSNLILSVRDKLYTAHLYRLSSVVLSSPSFNARIENIIIEETELEGFIKDLIQLEEVRQGEISLVADNPNQFSLSLYSIDKLGHFDVILHLGSGNNYKNTVDVSFEIDPSTLPDILIHFQECVLSMKEERKIKTSEYKQQSKIINEFLDEWNIIGLGVSTNTNEYLDLIDPILTLLNKNVNIEELANALSKMISSTYGIPMNGSDENVILFSKRVLEWWNS